MNRIIFSHLFIKILTKDVFVFKPGPSLVGALKKDWASQNSIALSWQQPEQTTLPILDYEIKYYEKVQLLLLLLECKLVGQYLGIDPYLLTKL